MTHKDGVLPLKTLPELLSPAGSYEALIAAVDAGADAVYTGAKKFSARAYADNLDYEQFGRGAEYCHRFGKKIYVAFNTLVYDREMREAVEMAENLRALGADALIMADPGAISAVRRYVPDIEIHASTQLSVHSSDGINALKKLGVTRAVLAREMPASDIKMACGGGCETEVFIHGALCVSYSGQCLFSSIVGGRSGNRGECAQPCRLPYSGGHPLSLKDLCLAKRIPELIELGIDSLKIEGRMKSPQYVYAVTQIYRKLLDERRGATDEESEILRRIFSRSGFTDGYFSGKIQTGMTGVRTEENKTESRSLFKITAKPNEKAEKLADDSTYNIQEKEERSTPKYVLPTLSVHGNKRQLKKTALFLKPELYSAVKRHISGRFDAIFLPLFSDQVTDMEANGIYIPPVIFDSQKEEVEKRLSEVTNLGKKYALVGNIGHIKLAIKYGLIPIGDFRLNAVNRESINFYREAGVADFIFSPELALAQMRDLYGIPIVYGHMPLMLTERCFIKENFGCNKCGSTMLTDRIGKKFPMLREYPHRNIILNSVPYYMGDRKKQMREAHLGGLEHFIFSIEKPENCIDIIREFDAGHESDFPYRRIPLTPAKAERTSDEKQSRTIATEKTVRNISNRKSIIGNTKNSSEIPDGRRRPSEPKTSQSKARKNTDMRSRTKRHF